MDYVYIAMLGGYEGCKVIGTYSDVVTALNEANKALRSDNFAYSDGYISAYVIKSELDGKVVSYIAELASGELKEFKEEETE